MNILIADDASGRYRIYLNDHRALLAAETALAQRSLDANDGELAHLLEQIVRQTTTDQRAIEALIERAGASTNPAKKIGALIGERAGRLKLNGQLHGYSPLSRVIEIESLLASTAVRRAMWNTIAALDIDADITTDAAHRASTADEQHTSLTQQHVDASLAALH